MNNLITSFTILGLFTCFSFQVFAADEQDNSATNIEVLAETNNPNNIHLNGKSFQHCVLFLEEGLTNIDKQPAKFVKVGIGNDRNKLETLTLFRIDSNGDYVYRWFYPNSDQIANRLTEKQLGYGYSFDSSATEIKYSNGSTCMSRETFTLKLKNGNLRAVESVERSNGTCSAGRFLLAIPAALASAETVGNDLECKFTN